MNTAPHVHVIDDEAPFLRSVLFLLESAGWPASGHDSAEAFLVADPPFPPGGGCLVADIRMPRVSGLELQRRLQVAGSPFPLIFVTGHGDVELAVEAMKAGAVDFLQKPFRDQPFLDAIERAVELSRAHHAASQRSQEARAILARLSPRETEVARWLALGWANKAIARQLAISEHTVHVHRQHIMDKTDAGSPADLARLILRADPTGLDEAGMAAD